MHIIKSYFSDDWCYEANDTNDKMEKKFKGFMNAAILHISFADRIINMSITQTFHKDFWVIPLGSGELLYAIIINFHKIW